LLWLLCVVRYRSLRRADHSSRGVLPTVVWRMWSRNLVNEGDLAHWGGGASRANNKQTNLLSKGNAILLRADHSSRGVLPTLVWRMLSRNLVNEGALAQWGGGLSRQKQTKKLCSLPSVVNRSHRSGDKLAVYVLCAKRKR
jgi:hypothetical protein